MAIPQREKASPWPFAAMIGLAGCFFLYAASGLFAPWYVVPLLLVLWLVLFVVATRWWTPFPKRTVWLPVLALAVWLGVVLLAAALDWNP